MEEALRFFRTYEMWMYVILALAGLVYIRKFILSWEELRRAAFGLERESAQSSLNQSAGMLVLLFVMAGISQVPVKSILDNLWPFYLALTAMVVIVAYVPGLSMFLVDAIGGQIK